MEFRIADTEKLLKNYEPYHRSIEKVNNEKDRFAKKIESIRDEMEQIVQASQKLILDDKTQQEKAERFRELQAEAVEIEGTFRQEITQLQNSELENNFNQVSDIIKEWADKNGVKYVLNKIQFAYASDEADCTDEVIELLKEKNLFEEYVENDMVFEIQN